MLYENIEDDEYQTMLNIKMHHIRTVVESPDHIVSVLRVPGGWIYITCLVDSENETFTTVFVPIPVPISC